MAIMMAKLYDALRAGNVPDDKAREAAEEAAGYESRAANIESTLRLHTWILTANTAGILMLIGLALHRG
jgi:hypothetical protein